MVRGAGRPAPASAPASPRLLSARPLALQPPLPSSPPLPSAPHQHHHRRPHLHLPPALMLLSPSPHPPRSPSPANIFDQTRVRSPRSATALSHDGNDLGDHGDGEEYDYDEIDDGTASAVTTFSAQAAGQGVGGLLSPASLSSRFAKLHGEAADTTADSHPRSTSPPPPRSRRRKFSFARFTSFFGGRPSVTESGDSAAAATHAAAPVPVKLRRSLSVDRGVDARVALSPRQLMRSTSPNAASREATTSDPHHDGRSRWSHLGGHRRARPPPPQLVPMAAVAAEPDRHSPHTGRLRDGSDTDDEPLAVDDEDEYGAAVYIPPRPYSLKDSPRATAAAATGQLLLGASPLMLASGDLSALPPPPPLVLPRRSLGDPADYHAEDYRPPPHRPVRSVSHSVYRPDVLPSAAAAAVMHGTRPAPWRDVRPLPLSLPAASPPASPGLPRTPSPDAWRDARSVSLRSRTPSASSSRRAASPHGLVHANQQRPRIASPSSPSSRHTHDALAQLMADSRELYAAFGDLGVGGGDAGSDERNDDIDDGDDDESPPPLSASSSPLRAASSQRQLSPRSSLTPADPSWVSGGRAGLFPPVVGPVVDEANQTVWCPVVWYPVPMSQFADTGFSAAAAATVSTPLQSRRQRHSYHAPAVPSPLRGTAPDRDRRPPSHSPIPPLPMPVFGGQYAPFDTLLPAPPGMAHAMSQPPTTARSAVSAGLRPQTPRGPLEPLRESLEARGPPSSLSSAGSASDIPTLYFWPSAPDSPSPTPPNSSSSNDKAGQAISGPSSGGHAAMRRTRSDDPSTRGGGAGRLRWESVAAAAPHVGFMAISGAGTPPPPVPALPQPAVRPSAVAVALAATGTSTVAAATARTSGSSSLMSAAAATPSSPALSFRSALMAATPPPAF